MFKIKAINVKTTQIETYYCSSSVPLEEFKEQVEKNDYGSRMLRCNHLYELTQNCVHEPTENFKDSVVLRTFIKVIFSKELFNGFGNAWNYMIPHIKSNKNRSAERNHGTIY